MKQIIGRSIIFGWMLLLLVINGAALSQDEHPTGDRAESTRPSPIALNPAAGSEVGFIYEAFLSPQQEGGEEEDTPGFIPAVFRSTEPSVPRDQRTSRGHAVIEFANDLSRAWVHLAVENVDPTKVNLLHLHCGRPGQLGPIIIDFALAGDINDWLADGQFSVEIVNADIVDAAAHGDGLIGAFTAGCPIVPAIPNDKVKTIAGLEYIARQGELYFNLHTFAQTYFGDIRGQFHLVGG
jgi:hypothetical protein